MLQRVREFVLLASPARIAALAVPFVLVLVLAVLMWWWDDEPEMFDPVAVADARAQRLSETAVTGYVTSVTAIELMERILDKPGGYMRNDVMPPTVWMDNVPSWEFGALKQVRDVTRALRNDLSRSQSQSAEDPDLSIADPRFHMSADSWMFPRTETQYREGMAALARYAARLGDVSARDAQFFARADNLRDWLAVVGNRLGSMAERLTAAVAETRFNTDLANDATATQSTPTPRELRVKTPWLDIDDVFYEARGTTWALVHLLKAVEHDFSPVLEDKNALVSLRETIRLLEATQQPLSSPIVLNGSGFGLTANHSLTLASYIARANARIIELQNLLSRG